MTGRGRYAGVFILAVWVLVAAGCAAVLRPSLDVPPGHRAVLGGLDLSRFPVTEGILEIVREGGGFDEAVRVGLGSRAFAISLPPGFYRVIRLRAFRDGHRFPNDAVWDVGLRFEVGREPAVYIGTIEVLGGWERRLRFRVLDEYDATVGVLRARYADIPEVVARSLLEP